MRDFLQLTNRTINLDRVIRIDWYPPGANNNRDWAASVYFAKDDNIYIQTPEDVQALAAAVGFTGDSGATDPDVPFG